MTLKEELEILRGEPIKVFTGDPMSIPCIETSDPDKLCQHPVVSVQMITYNHEPYIRQAIEGVMMQKTDFEFELIIGEDCSQDKTREICFEYQKKYPDKIRVLWWHENVSKLGGNGRRCVARRRGEFVALCEGDDYWTDPLKLQKQVDVMRKYPNVGLCFCGSKIYRGVTQSYRNWNEGFKGFCPGLIPSSQFVLWTLFGKNPNRRYPGDEFFVMTATLVFRNTTYLEAIRRYDIFSWRLPVGDATLCLGIGSLADVYYLAENVSMYRQMPTGITVSGSPLMQVTTFLIRLYFYQVLFELPASTAPAWIQRRICSILQQWLATKSRSETVRYFWRNAWRNSTFNIYRNVAFWPMMLFSMLHLRIPILVRAATAFMNHFSIRMSSRVKIEYAKYEHGA